jgi:hypothetical protein
MTPVYIHHTQSTITALLARYQQTDKTLDHSPPTHVFHLISWLQDMESLTCRSPSTQTLHLVSRLQVWRLLNLKSTTHWRR